MLKRKICVVTGSRAEYGILSGLIRAINEDRGFDLRLVVTGSHLSGSFGRTYQQIEKDGFKIDARIPILNRDNTPGGIVSSVGRGCVRFSQVFKKLLPDGIVLCGDRYEAFAAAVAAYFLGIPIIHLHGGETTQGAVDEALRHSITKMAYIHFVTTRAHARRVVQLGEDPGRVYYVGAPALDHLSRMSFLTREALQSDLGFDLSGKFAMSTFHPVTLDQSSPVDQVKEMLAAIERSGLKTVFTKANADAGGVLVNEVLAGFVKKDPSRYLLVDSLGSLKYFSCLKHAALMIGNSSSGIIESASFRIPVVNIGDRQRGRVRSRNVIDVDCDRRKVLAGIRQALSVKFLDGLRGLRNLYRRPDGQDASFLMKDVLATVSLDPAKVLKKVFFDLKEKERSVVP